MVQEGSGNIRRPARFQLGTLVQQETPEFEEEKVLKSFESVALTIQCPVSMPESASKDLQKCCSF